ncbi:serine/threonine-protein phosphatase 7 long form homolog [Rutidosis leptorrhynchoides]|uniref:serine/threonine-protein phosphatase 7 long form homolog n=1 Tax=Rutidosis leptorrhynchoides TaxID=125765 RepID=UPI003A99E08E
MAQTNQKLDEEKLIKPRRADLSFWQHISRLPNETIDERVQVYLDNVGLGLVCKLGKQRLDWSFVTAMIERWCPETHTFHLPIGEATVTLQDVQVLFGLPIDGDVFSSIWYETNDSDWIPFVVTYLGIAPQAIGNRGIHKGRILISILITELAEDVGDTVESHQQRARVYILAMMGGVLFSDSNAYDVPLSFLHTILDLSLANCISWGSAVLAHLYRNLCKATTNYEARAINGSLLLVQLWHGKRKNKNTPAHVLSTVRSLLSALTPRQQPYDDLLFARLPQQCAAD